MYVYHGVKSISWISVSYTHVCMWTVKAGKMNDFAQWHVTMSYGWHIKIKILAGLLPGALTASKWKGNADKQLERILQSPF